MLLGLIKHAAQVDDAFAVELQRGDGGASGRRETQDERTVLVPAEMLIPVLLTRMKERNCVARAWIAGGDFAVLVLQPWQASARFSATVSPPNSTG